MGRFAWMSTVVAAVTATVMATVLSGCAAPVAPPDVFRDALFAPSREVIDADAVFAVSEPMRRFLRAGMAAAGRGTGRRDALVQALYGRDGAHGSLRLEYDAARTRNAAEAFEARAGNCLSLVIMTAAFARELDLDVRFQAAAVEEAWSRQGDLLVGAGHVNVTLLGRRADPRIGFEEAPLTIDFLPQELLPGMRVRNIDAATVVAMYMNNRAVESLAEGRLDDAYAFAREAIRQHPADAVAFNTLGVIYQRHGDLPEAERAWAAALARDRDDPRALANLAELRVRQGRPGEAADYRARLARLRPTLPYLAFALGQEAMRRQDFDAARGYFREEIARSAADPDLHYWLALAEWRLGALDAAEAQLRLAGSTSRSSERQDLYAAKLAWLRSQRAQDIQVDP